MVLMDKCNIGGEAWQSFNLSVGAERCLSVTTCPAYRIHIAPLCFTWLASLPLSLNISRCKDFFFCYNKWRLAWSVSGTLSAAFQISMPLWSWFVFICFLLFEYMYRAALLYHQWHYYVETLRRFWHFITWLKTQVKVLSLNPHTYFKSHICVCLSFDSPRGFLHLPSFVPPISPV